MGFIVLGYIKNLYQDLSHQQKTLLFVGLGTVVTVGGVLYLGAPDGTLPPSTPDSNTPEFVPGDNMSTPTRGRYKSYIGMISTMNQSVSNLSKFWSLTTKVADYESLALERFNASKSKGSTVVRP